LEIEILLAGSAQDPRSVDRWTPLPARQRSDECKYGKLLKVEKEMMC
jgi:hypothetical protein